MNSSDNFKAYEARVSFSCDVADVSDVVETLEDAMAFVDAHLDYGAGIDHVDEVGHGANLQQIWVVKRRTLGVQLNWCYV